MLLAGLGPGSSAESGKGATFVLNGTGCREFDGFRHRWKTGQLEFWR
jgi:hypothetical protein